MQDSFEPWSGHSDTNYPLHQKLTTMKRYTQVALAILLVGFTSESCKKESFPGVEKFENLLELSSPALLRIAFNELTATEKADFWKYNLRKKMDGLTGVQRNLI